MADSEEGLTPANIERIRRAFDDTKERFSDRVGVSTATIYNWEAGTSAPTPTNSEALRELIPDDVAVDDLEDGALATDEPGGHELRLYRSEKLQTLRDRPATADELNGGLTTLTAAQRRVVERLTVTGVQGSTKRMPEVTSVFYLVGDDRRAMRRFIEENGDLVEGALSTRSNKLSSEWSEFAYSLLLDEWRFYCAEGH